MPVPGVLVSPHPGPIVQRETGPWRCDGEGIAGPLVALPLPVQIHLETCESGRSRPVGHWPLQRLHVQANRDGDPLCAGEHQPYGGTLDHATRLQGGMWRQQGGHHRNIQVAAVDCGMAHQRLWCSGERLDLSVEGQGGVLRASKRHVPLEWRFRKRRALSMQVDAVGDPLISHLESSIGQRDLDTSIGKAKGLRRLGRSRVWVRYGGAPREARYSTGRRGDAAG